MLQKASRLFLILFQCISICYAQEDVKPTGELFISSNGHYLVHSNGDPFFWLGDTGWRMFTELNRKEISFYLKDRQQKGFTVVQAVLVNDMPAVNVYGDSAFVNNNMAEPNVVSGNDSENPAQYDYWDHIDYAIDEAAKYGIYLAIIPAWGSLVKNGKLNKSNAADYIQWIARRYHNKPNIIWLNGGDVKGDENLEVFNIIGNTIKSVDATHLVGFHPFGRTQSSQWFHNARWLDFNMVQSGHKDYKQDTMLGCDNWKLIQADFYKKPEKPIIDGEPAYEGIPHGLHDINQPYWNAADTRRYMYWALFSGAFGHTYGNNSVMQFYSDHSKTKAYGPKKYWESALDDEGATQVQYAKKLMLSHDYLSGEPAQYILPNNKGTQYNYLVATKGKNYAMVYTYTGAEFEVDMSKVTGNLSRAYWIDPRSGKTTSVGKLPNDGVLIFEPPGGAPKDGNDWVLVLEAINSKR